MPSRPSKTWTSLRHHRRRSRHTVRHHYFHHLTYQSCSTSHLTGTHHVSTRAPHRKTPEIAESTQTPVMAHSLQPLPYWRSVQASRWCWSAHTDRERALVPDSQQRGLLTQYCSHCREAPIPHAHTQAIGIHWHHPQTMLSEQRPAYRTNNVVGCRHGRQRH